MASMRLTEEEWKALEPALAEAERRAEKEFFTDQGLQLSPGTLLLRHLLQRGDVEGVVLLRAAEMHQHELSRAGYAAAFFAGKGTGGEEQQEA